MARIRTIKPEFWGDEKFALMTPKTRLLFLALISMADDCGRLLDSVSRITAFVYPFEENEGALATLSRDVRESLATLTDAGRITRGTNASGQKVIQITKWESHQKVDRPNLKAALSKIVAPYEVTKSSRKPRESVAKSSRGSRESVALHTNDHHTNDHHTNDLGSLPADAEAAAQKTTWLTPYLDLWLSRVGALTPKRAAAALAEPRRQHGDEALLQGLAAYLDQPRDPDKPVKVEYFAEKAAVWVKLGAMPLVDPVTRALRPGA
jgi:hypothetical protein